jgi:hypothetical protein
VPNILVHLGCIRPIRLNCDNGKIMVFHEVPRDSGPSTIKLRRAMARLSKHNDPSMREAIKYLSESRIADVGQVFRSLSEKVQQDPVVRCVEHMTSLIAARACSKLFDLIPKNVPGVHNDPCLHHGSRVDLLVMASGGCNIYPVLKHEEKRAIGLIEHEDASAPEDRTRHQQRTQPVLASDDLAMQDHLTPHQCGYIAGATTAPESGMHPW